MARIVAIAVARLLWIEVPVHGSAVVFVCDAEFIRSWRENRP